MFTTVQTLAEHLDQEAAYHGWTRAEQANGAIVYTSVITPGRELMLFLRDQGTLQIAFTHRGRAFRTYFEVMSYLQGDQVPWVAVAKNRELQIRYTRREFGGWYVTRLDNGRILGWVVRNPDNPKSWDARLNPGAFRGTGPDDEGDILDEVSPYLFNGSDNLTSRPISVGCKTQLDGADAILYQLIRDNAPAVTDMPYGHYAVKRWADR